MGTCEISVTEYTFIKQIFTFYLSFMLSLVELCSELEQNLVINCMSITQQGVSYIFLSFCSPYTTPSYRASAIYSPSNCVPLHVLCMVKKQGEKKTKWLETLRQTIYFQMFVISFHWFRIDNCILYFVFGIEQVFIQIFIS